MFKVLLPGMLSYYIELFIFSFISFSKSKRRKWFYLRLFFGILLGIPTYFIPASLRIGDVNVMFLIVCIYVGLISVFLFETKPMNYFFNAITAMALQHLSWNLFCSSYSMIESCGVVLDFAFILWIYLLLYLFIIVVSFVISRHFFDEYSFNKMDTISFVAGLCFMLVCYVLSNTIHSWTIHLRIYTIISSVFVLLIQSGVFNYRKKEVETMRLEMENTQLQLLIDQQGKNQEMVKQSLDLINGKYHDIKKQLAVIKESSEETKQECILDIEKSISSYDNIARTGNDVLDVVLTQKSMVCTSSHIKFTYIVDGPALSFIKNNDLSALFANILDNAIESVLKEEEPNRIIKLNVMKKKGFLIIKQENYCSRAIEFKNGLPVSSKDDQNEHGYGAKSISFIASKYLGNVSFDYTENVFSVNILLPISD